MLKQRTRNDFNCLNIKYNLNTRKNLNKRRIRNIVNLSSLINDPFPLNVNPNNTKYGTMALKSIQMNIEKINLLYDGVLINRNTNSIVKYETQTV
jgi:hypothetical protein